MSTFVDRNFRVSNGERNEDVFGDTLNCCVAIDASDAQDGLVSFFCLGKSQEDALGVVTSGISVNDHVLTVGQLELVLSIFFTDLHRLNK
jgi:hypothetical protein